MTTLVIISLLLAVGGVSAVCGGGVPESISSVVYALRKDRQWLWSVWLFVVTALLMPRLLELTQLAGWLTVACLVGVAYIESCLNEGWAKKDNFDWTHYEEALNPVTD